MKNLFLLLAFVCGIFAVNAAELLTNRTFEKNFAGWTVRGGKGSTLKSDNGAAVFNGENKSFLIQYKLPVKAGKYHAEYTVSGSGKIQVYCETNGNVNGKRYYKTSGAQVMDVPEKSEKRTFDFVITEDAVGLIQNFAFVVVCSNSKNIRVSDLSLQMVTAGDEILTNRTFEKNFAGWTRRIGKDSVLKSENGTAVFNGNTRSYLVHYKLPVKAGQYHAEYTVSGSGKYKVYCEINRNINGKAVYRTSGAATMNAPQKSETRAFDFVVTPEEAEGKTSFAFIICMENGKDLRILEPSLKLVSSQSKEAVASSVAAIGGKWQLANGCFFSGSGANLMLNQISRGNLYFSKLAGIPVKGGKRYRFSCRTYGIKTNDSTGSCGFRIIPKAKDKELLIPAWDDTWQGEKQIKYLEFDVPADVDATDLYFEVVYGSQVGFFDFKLEEIPAKVPVSSFIMTSPYYRDTVYSSMPVKNLSGSVTLRGKAVSSKVTLTVDGKNIQAVPGNDGVFSFDSPGKDCRITVDFFGADGKKISSAFRDIRFPAKFHTEVTLDKDNFMCINGKRFFPVVFWELTAIHEADGMYYAAKRGVNCFILTDRYMKNHAQKLEALNRAQKYGIKVFLQVPSIDHLTDDKIEQYKRDFDKMNPAKIRNHPAVIGYFITDEPIWRGVPQNRVVNGYKIIKEIDPYRAVWLNAAPRNSVEVHASYAEGVDIYGIDIYPYPYPSTHSGFEDKGLTCVGKYTDFCREAVADRKAVWMALQGFSWFSYRNPDNGSGYPGLNQMRFMWYDTLFHGGRGGSIWGTRHIRSEAFYDTLFDVTSEMHMVSGLFTQFDKMETVVSQDKNIIAELMSVGNEKYLIVRNTAEKPEMSQLKGKFPAMKQLYPASARVLDAGKCQVSLEPFEVVIYGTAALPAPAYQLPEADSEFDKLRNPFKRVTKMDIGKIRYNGNANWIWDKEMLKPYARINAERKFTIDPAAVKDITLFIAIDDNGVCRFNGKEVATLTTSYADMQMVKIPKELWKAENVITVDASDTGMTPCGILAEIRITGVDGKIRQIFSDKEWSCNGKPAHIVAKFGSGAWGKRVSYQELDAE